MPEVRAQSLTLDEADRIVETLAPYVSDARKARIETVLSARMTDVTVVLENIYGAHNAAAVLRTAEAFGLAEVHIIPQSVQFRVSRKVSQGAHKWLRVVQHPNISHAYATLRTREVAIFAADVRPSARPVTELPVDRPIALVFGNEHEGLSVDALEHADGRFTVPMRGFVESLNISVACAVAVHDVIERRRREGRASVLDPLPTARLRAAWYAASVRAARALLVRAGLPEPVLCGESLIVSDDDR